MGYFDAIILGIVEGLTEFLPVSSTGHLILTEHILGISQSEFVKSFTIAIQIGAILAVVRLYWQTLLHNRRVLKLVAVSSVPTAVVGAVLYPYIKEFLLGNPMIVVGALAVGGVVLMLVERHVSDSGKRGIEVLTFWRAAGIGLVQAIAIVPGVSRAAATIMGGLFAGLNRKAAVEFSFLLAIPTIFGATALDIIETGIPFSRQDIFSFLLGIAVAYITAILSIRFFISMLQKRAFFWFGLYRIVIAGLFWITFLR